jgi:hypothetical protein
MATDDSKKLILARRARFVAAALAGVSVACGKEPTSPPEPCLSVPIQPRDAEPEPPPQPCLTPMLADAGAPADTDAGATTTTESQAQKRDASAPRPCLSDPLESTTSKPRPCLIPPLEPKNQR